MVSVHMGDMQKYKMQREYLVYCVDVQLSIKKKLWPIGKGRIEDGISGRQKGFWDSPRLGRLPRKM